MAKMRRKESAIRNGSFHWGDELECENLPKLEASKMFVFLLREHFVANCKKIPLLV